MEPLVEKKEEELKGRRKSKGGKKVEEKVSGTRRLSDCSKCFDAVTLFVAHINLKKTYLLQCISMLLFISFIEDFIDSIKTLRSRWSKRVMPISPSIGLSGRNNRRE